MGEREGIGMGIDESVLTPLRDKIAQAKQFMESAYRRFLTSCLKGRDLVWVDTSSNKKKKATATLDLTLKNFKISDPSGTQISTCKVKDVVAKRAKDYGDNETIS